ncbi:MAG: GNAT family N-acetyltransferase [Deltaproteobacteria bacterium]|nr:GNAT family N-acetyltransferase [Deltaproteobacteria bacterium]
MPRTLLRELSGDERASYFSGMVSLWGGGLPEDKFVAWQRRLADSSESAGRYRLLGLFDQDAGELLSALKAYTFEGSVEGEPVRVLGIGAVFTPERLRKRGFASRLLHLAMEDARLRGHDCALLFSDIGTRYYEELGFFALESNECQLDPQSLPKSHGFRAAAPGDELTVSRIFAACRTPQPRFSLARDGWSVRFQLRRLRELARVRDVGEPEWGLIVEGSLGDAAAMIRHTKEALDVLDCAWTTNQARDRLLGGLRECALRSNRARIRVWPAHQTRPLWPFSPRSSAIAMIAPIKATVRLPPAGTRAELALLDHI